MHFLLYEAHCHTLPYSRTTLSQYSSLLLLIANPVAQSVVCWTGLTAKSFYSFSFLMHVVQIANHQYHLLLSLKFFGRYGLSETFTKTWSEELCCGFVVSSLLAIVVDGSKSFSFPHCFLIRIVSWTTPGSVSLVHGFTHDKSTSVPYLFSTPQARCQQKTEILIHLLKNLAPVNDINGVLYLVLYVDIFSTNMERTSVNGCACALAETLLFMVQSHYKSCVFPYGTCWCTLSQNTWHPRMCIPCTQKIARYLVLISFSAALVVTFVRLSI